MERELHGIEFAPCSADTAVNFNFGAIQKISPFNGLPNSRKDKERIQCDILAHGISYIGDNWVSGIYDLTPEEAADATLELMT